MNDLAGILLTAGLLPVYCLLLGVADVALNKILNKKRVGK